MQVLEKILKRIEQRIIVLDKKAERYDRSERQNEADKLDCEIKGLKTASNIIRSCMEDDSENEPVSNPYKLDDGWIPVEERLPEPGVYLVSCDDKEYPVKRMRMKGICFFDHNGIYGGKVYAWQPLPAQYQPKPKEQ